MQLPLEPEVFTQNIKITGAKNWRRPNPSRDYGHIGAKMFFELVGPQGAISVALFMDWYVKSSRDEWIGKDMPDYRPRYTPYIADVSYHAYEPQYEDQTCNNCHLLKGGKCYSDGSSLTGDDMMEGFIAGGSEWMFKKMRELYESRFNDAPYPDFTPEYDPHPDDRKEI
jgi:hypothetical protein